MSTLTSVATGSTSVRRHPPHRVTFAHVLSAEWIKFWSLRSTVWTLAATVVLMAAVSYLAVFFTAREAFNRPRNLRTRRSSSRCCTTPRS
jgi:hypothetical protein